MGQGWICGVEDQHCGGTGSMAVSHQVACEAVPHCWVLLCSFPGLGGTLVPHAGVTGPALNPEPQGLGSGGADAIPGDKQEPVAFPGTGCCLFSLPHAWLLDLGRWHPCYRGSRPHLLCSPCLFAFPGSGCRSYGAAPHSAPLQRLLCDPCCPKAPGTALHTGSSWLPCAGMPLCGEHIHSDGGTGGKQGPLVARIQLHTALRPCMPVLWRGSG